MVGFWWSVGQLVGGWSVGGFMKNSLHLQSNINLDVFNLSLKKYKVSFLLVRIFNLTFKVISYLCYVRFQCEKVKIKRLLNIMKLFIYTDGSWIFISEGKSTLDIAFSFDFSTELWKVRV